MPPHILRREFFTQPERLSHAWTLTKGTKMAVCETWSHVLGVELRVGNSKMYSVAHGHRILKPPLDHTDSRAQLAIVGHRPTANLSRYGVAHFLASIDHRHQFAIRQLRVLLRMKTPEIADANYRRPDFIHALLCARLPVVRQHSSGA